MKVVLDQIDNRCLICKEDWIQDQFLENCHPICGDGIIHGQENVMMQIQYLMILVINENIHVQTFVKLVNSEIVFNVFLDLNLMLILIVPLCGDGNVVPYSAEQCDLTDNGEWDDGQDCSFRQFSNQNACFPNCGEKLILQQYEECDDGGWQPYDGFFQCKFQFTEDCNICHEGQCILKCEDGYKFVNNSCLSVCGDQIVTKEEDCDDDNTIQFDGCVNCKYSYTCPENCYDYYQGTCSECNDQYQLLISNQCRLKLNCGDGLLQKQEECDDGNYEAVDGCNDCLIEQNWMDITMIRDTPSQCAFVEALKLVINYLNVTSNNQYITIQINQQVKIYTTQLLSETFNFELLNIDRKNWNSSLYIEQDVGSYVNFGEYVIKIEMHQLLQFKSVLKILVNQSVANIDNAVLDEFTKSITLHYPQYLDESQKDYSYKLKSLNTYLIYGFFWDYWYKSSIRKYGFIY